MGSYPSTCTGATAANYTITPVNGSVSVTAAALTVTASNGTMTYGGTVPTITPSYSGFVNGQGSSVVTGTTCSTTATASSAVGSYPSTCTGATAANYTITPVNGSVSVTAAALTVTASSGTMTYGGTVPTHHTQLQRVREWARRVGGDGNDLLDHGDRQQCGGLVSQQLAPGATAANYTITPVNGSVSVTAAALTVTASSGTMTYGGTVPTITPSYSGFVNGQGSSVVSGTTCSTTATSGSAVGRIPALARGPRRPTTLLTPVNGTVSVTAAALTVTASSGTMTYGGTVPTITPSYSGFVNGQGSSVMTGTTCSTTATSGNAVGSIPALARPGGIRAAWASVGRAACPNGHPTLACNTQILHIATTDLAVGPLPNFAIIRDLVPDLLTMFEKHRSLSLTSCERMKRKSTTRKGSSTSLPRSSQRYLQFSYCIKCGCCMAACPTLGHRRAISRTHAPVGSTTVQRRHSRRRAARSQRPDRLHARRIPLSLRRRVFACLPQGCGPRQGDPASQAAVGAGLSPLGAPKKTLPEVARAGGREAAPQHPRRPGQDRLTRTSQHLVKRAGRGTIRSAQSILENGNCIEERVRQHP